VSECLFHSCIFSFGFLMWSLILCRLFPRPRVYGACGRVRALPVLAAVDYVSRLFIFRRTCVLVFLEFFSYPLPLLRVRVSLSLPVCVCVFRVSARPSVCVF
jgi:hypothetical protein